MRARFWHYRAGASLVPAIIILFSIRYIDRPLARLVGTFRLFRHILAKAPVGFPILLILAGVAIVLALAQRCMGKPLPRWLTAATIASLALIFSVALTEFGLKFIFGRTLASAYLRSGTYGFHWFHAGERFGSFPSGHADQAAAILSVLWVFYPRWRRAYVAAMLLLSFALIAGEWHFLSDIIAGAYVGTVVGVATMSIWDAASKRRCEWSDARHEKSDAIP